MNIFYSLYISVMGAIFTIASLAIIFSSASSLMNFQFNKKNIFNLIHDFYFSIMAIILGFLYIIFYGSKTPIKEIGVSIIFAIFLLIFFLFKKEFNFQSLSSDLDTVVENKNREPGSAD